MRKVSGDGKLPLNESIIKLRYRVCVRCHEKDKLLLWQLSQKELVVKNTNIKRLTTLAVLISSEIILSRFLSVNAWNIKIGFSFIPVVIAALLYGAVPAACVAAAGDFLGALLFPIGAYFPGFTFTAFLTGMVFGIFLYRKNSRIRILAAVVTNQFILSLFLNTFWISLLYGSPFWPLLVTRIAQSVLLSIFEFVIISVLIRRVPYLRKDVV